MDDDTPLHVIIAAVPASSWAPAELMGTVQYVRGCKEISLPQEVKECLPQYIGGWDDPVENRLNRMAD